jgi:HEAT repeat protein
MVLELIQGEKDDVVVEQLAIALRAATSVGSVSVLSEYLKHPNRAVRGHAAAALGEIGDGRAVAPLTERLRHERDGWCAKTMREALQRLQQNQALSELVRAALGDGAGLLQVREGLAVLEHTGIAERLVAAGGRDAKVQQGVLATIQEHRETAAVPLLLLLMENENRDDRAEAVKVLRALTGVLEGFEPDGSQAERLAGLGRWRSWWDRHVKRFR